MSEHKSAEDAKCVALSKRLIRCLTAKSHDLDRLVEGIARRTNAPYAFLSIMNDARLTHVARFGLDLCDVDVRISFTRFIGERGLCVRDTSADWRFRYHPLVQCGPMLRSYIGQPILLDGCITGSISAAGSVPNLFSDADLNDLGKDARAAQCIIEEMCAEGDG